MDFYAIEKGIEGDSEIKKLLKESGLNASQLLDFIKTAEDITPYVEDLSIIRNITGYIEDNEKPTFSCCGQSVLVDKSQIKHI